jgi:hypothetical protein
MFTVHFYSSFQQVPFAPQQANGCCAFVLERANEIFANVFNGQLYFFSICSNVRAKRDGAERLQVTWVKIIVDTSHIVRPGCFFFP